MENRDLMKHRQGKDTVSDGLVKEALLEYNDELKLGYTPDEIRHLKVERGIHGKPYFADLNFHRQKPQIHFSVSHSESWWACLLADEPVGLDIEVNKEKVKYKEIAKRFFTEEEYTYVLKHGEEGFFQLWVCKEAFLKYRGTGLSEGLNSFSVVGNGKLLSFIKSKNDSGIDGGIFLNPIEIRAGITAAYCIKNQRKVEKISEILTVKQ
ncbi:4'-phosphopantetheinyl transferase family protein [Sinanaerobacter chloroacetimidivorans]|uniref:4'-phosphopantetheinyl transferase superfamily protein n=1 Tax=Sinanaerobacter chloroacetimidivorans TaxID=2818044 RepID=A0A8J8B449_9FIRM|nr:4'-phosphopantetheinyl transferase superfamily protein [Sinanaerobacter chloroacetimidivorans]MBR0598975.1 4'-phosphopantetheinyl transferase superfamily protein [Sinanaerobacter chloroacetimidivorans]